jgi:hypothetical protein
MFGKWEVREFVYQINFPPFSPRVDKRTKEQKFIFGIFNNYSPKARGDQLSGNIRQDEVEVNIPL